MWSLITPTKIVVLVDGYLIHSARSLEIVKHWTSPTPDVQVQTRLNPLCISLGFSIYTDNNTI
jgi:hypothetical protein